MWSKALAALLVVAAGLAACRQPSVEAVFPKPQRDVAPIVGDAFSTEDVRDRVGEATHVIELAAVRPGMWVADVGAGEGYYTVRLAPVVGRRGRVLAEDIIADTYQRLLQRVQRENLDNVAVRLGTADDPKLPPGSFDRIFLVHVYHEVESPYAFLWHLREGLKPDGEVIVVDSDRPVRRHGIPPSLLECELGAVGLKMTRKSGIPGSDAYFTAFRISRERPAPADIKPCKG